jgi:hypothetical protein
MNTRRLLSLFALLFLGGAILHGQGWERIYPNVSGTAEAGAKKVLPAPGGGFLVLVSDHQPVGLDFHIMQTDGSGTVQWVREYHLGGEEAALDFIATADGGYAVLYNQLTQSQVIIPYLLKLDAQFDVEFQVNLEDAVTQGETFVAAAVLDHGAGFWIAGEERTAVGAQQKGALLGLDYAGNVQSYVNWGMLVQTAQDAVLAPDGGAVTTGYGLDAPVGSGSVGITRINAAGTAVLWEVVVGEPGSNFYSSTVIAAPGGGYLVGTTKNSQPYLIRLDEQGNILWEQYYALGTTGGLGMLGLSALTPTAAGDGYWMTGGDDSFIPKIVLARLDLQGNPLFTNHLGLAGGYNFGLDLLGQSDGGVLIAGSRSLQPYSDNQVPYLLHTTAAGITFADGVSGQVSYDQDGDCVGDVDTISAGMLVTASQNGVLINSAQTGALGEYFLPLNPGDYLITVLKSNNALVICPDTIPVTVVAGDTVENVDFTHFYDPQPIDTVSGTVFQDYDGDCIQDPFEPGYANWNVVVTLYGLGLVHTATAVTDANGYFYTTDLGGLDNTATGLISVSDPAGDGLNCTVGCPDNLQIEFISSNSYNAAIGVHCDSLPPCPVMEVDIATAALRPCMESTYHVQYCNQGAVTATGAYVEVTVDTGLIVTGSSVPWAGVNGTTYTFLLGDLATEQCGSFSLTVEVPCNDPVGQTYCMEAHAYPDTICTGPGPDWDGSIVEVSATCDGDSVTFTITNAGNGNMQQPLEYIVIEDNVLFMPQPGSFLLGAGQSQAVTLPADGSFFRLEADQSPGYPGLNLPVAWAEGCGGAPGNVSFGFVNQYPMGDAESWLDIFCLESVNSFDPNDKTGFPLGYAAEHWIPRDQEMEYLIRFQNTGTAPAIDIEIRDTLPLLFLDPATVRPGASSHPYTWDMQGQGVVVFRFAGINLPDSAANLAASQGFVKFRVDPRPNVPLLSEIRNSAAIYFDFNDPVITNQTLHTVGDNFIVVPVKKPVESPVAITVSPNPAYQRVAVTVQGLKSGEELTWVLFDVLGREVMRSGFNGPSGEFQVGSLPAGAYHYEIRQKSNRLSGGRLVKVAP